MPLVCKGLTNYYNAWLDSTEIMSHSTEEDPWGDKWVATNGGGFGGYRVTGDRAGHWSVRVSGNWRVVFRFVGGEAVDVDLIDYH